MAETKELRVYEINPRVYYFTDEHNVFLFEGGLRLGDANRRGEERFVDDFFEPGRKVHRLPINPDWTHDSGPVTVKAAYTLPGEIYEKLTEKYSYEASGYSAKTRKIRDATTKKCEELKKKSEERIKKFKKPVPLEQRILAALKLV